MAIGFRSIGHFTRNGITTTVWSISGTKALVQTINDQEDADLWSTDPEKWCRDVLARNQFPVDQEYAIDLEENSKRPVRIRICFNSERAGYGTTRSRRKIVALLAGFLQEEPANAN